MSKPEHYAVIPAEMAAAQKNIPYSPGHRCGDLLFVSGQVGRDMVSGNIPADPEQQYAKAFENLALVLETSGATISDVVELVSYHVSFEDIGSFIAVQKRYFATGPHPAWTAVGVTRLMDPALLVEIKCTAMPGAPPNP